MSEKKKFLLRIDQELYTVLKQWADDDLRSINAQIEYLPKQSAQQSGHWKKKSHHGSDDA
ncbi:hypothetical protein IQ268_03045 [Oculatella sp. LEGE 06141]|uniref:hypothetical protein n=1 Tax=Oculatella sp. LEGE 06141 TaxID=1828648 RepID=UPI0018827BB6|nr:hypothetical protein [Oculatella sp. LEGE 06141]MBE9177553.1 hypothetical protein [Oculatella sp. LEGE 06141]